MGVAKALPPGGVRSPQGKSGARARRRPRRLHIRGNRRLLDDLEEALTSEAGLPKAWHNQYDPDRPIGDAAYDLEAVQWAREPRRVARRVPLFDRCRRGAEAAPTTTGGGGCGACLRLNCPGVVGLATEMLRLIKASWGRWVRHRAQSRGITYLSNHRRSRRAPEVPPSSGSCHLPLLLCPATNPRGRPAPLSGIYGQSAASCALASTQRAKTLNAPSCSSASCSVSWLAVLWA